MQGCYDNYVMVFKLVEALRVPALEYYDSLPAETRGQLSTLCTLLNDVLADRNLQRQRGAT